MASETCANCGTSFFGAIDPGIAPTAGFLDNRGLWKSSKIQALRGCSSMVERQLPKLHTRVESRLAVPAIRGVTALGAIRRSAIFLPVRRQEFSPKLADLISS